MHSTLSLMPSSYFMFKPQLFNELVQLNTHSTVQSSTLAQPTSGMMNIPGLCVFVFCVGWWMQVKMILRRTWTNTCYRVYCAWYRLIKHESLTNKPFFCKYHICLYPSYTNTIIGNNQMLPINVRCVYITIGAQSLIINNSNYLIIMSTNSSALTFEYNMLYGEVFIVGNSAKC